jgi:hypothetical protein
MHKRPEEALHTPPLSALASLHQAGYFVQKTHQNARYGSFLASYPILMAERQHPKKVMQRLPEIAAQARNDAKARHASVG